MGAWDYRPYPDSQRGLCAYAERRLFRSISKQGGGGRGAGRAFWLHGFHDGEYPIRHDRFLVSKRRNGLPDFQWGAMSILSSFLDHSLETSRVFESFVFIDLSFPYVPL